MLSPLSTTILAPAKLSHDRNDIILCIDSKVGENEQNEQCAAFGLRQ